MAILYDDDERKTFNLAVVHRLNPTRQYLKHYDNLMYLTFIRDNTDDRVERYQAGKEVVLCERKLKYWRSRPGYDEAQALTGVGQIKARWRQGEGTKR